METGNIPVGNPGKIVIRMFETMDVSRLNHGRALGHSSLSSYYADSAHGFISSISTVKHEGARRRRITLGIRRRLTPSLVYCALNHVRLAVVYAVLRLCPWLMRLGTSSLFV